MSAATFGHFIVTPMELSPGEQIAIMTANTAIPVCATMANIFRRQVADVPCEPLGLPRIPVAGFIAFGVLLVTNVVLGTGVLTLG